MGFLGKLLGIKDNTELIEKKFDDLLNKLTSESSTLRVENSSLRNQVATKDRSIQELSGKLRKQCEADLFLEMKLLEKKILDGDKMENIDLRNYNSLSAMRNMYEAQQRNGAFQGLLGQLGGAGRGLL